MPASALLLTLLLASAQFQVAGEVTAPPGTAFQSVEIESIDGRFVKTGEINRNGKFSIKKVPEGLYKITIKSEGGRLEQRTIEVRPAFADADGRVAIKLDVADAAPPKDQLTVGVAALRISPKATDELQRAYDARGKTKKVRAHLEKAIEISPDFPEALNNLGTTYYHEKEYGKAAELFQKALDVNPGFYPARVNLGGALLSLRNYDRALAENLKAVEIMPNESLAQAQLGQAFFHLNQYDKALEHLKIAKQLDPMSFTLPGLFIAQIYQARGERTAAIAEYKELLKMHPGYEYAAPIQNEILFLERQSAK
jgi:tetratricopeptide (TPR) repeat protein